MKVFYGAAIQGDKDRKERAATHLSLIKAIKDHGFDVAFDKARGGMLVETAVLLDKWLESLGKVSAAKHVRNKLIDTIEGDIDAAVFEVSVPSLGTGIEIAHAYLRPRLGKQEIPILLLHQQDYWGGRLSSMIRGADQEMANVQLAEYRDLDQAKQILASFLDRAKKD